MTKWNTRFAAAGAALSLLLLTGSTAFTEGGRPASDKLVPSLAAGLESTKDISELAVWVFFTDKGNQTTERAAEKITNRAERRRAKAGYIRGEGDLPLYAPYVSAVEEIAGEIRTRTKWLNGLSVKTDRAGLEALAALPFVREIRAVGKRAPRIDLPAKPADTETPLQELHGKAADDSLDYGLTRDQLNQINVPPLHNAGLSGAGVHILMLDSGFHTVAPAYDDMIIADRWDFVHDDSTVSDEEEDVASAENHGSATLSCIGASDMGMLVGPAYGATFYLGKTEDNDGEYEQEEDFWLEGVEWGESLGVEMLSSSLGYIDWYTYEDMDGRTAVTTLGAQEAIRRGIIVVNSQGNEALYPWRYMIAPADGDSVLSIGAVNINGGRSSFSSFGPTFDGRIKPDVSALGSGVSLVANPRSDENPYGNSSGTSFSAPIVAGVVALMLEAHPSMTVHDLFPAIKMTAGQADAPDIQLGWGIVNAFDAVVDMIVTHEPPDTSDWTGGGYPGEAAISLPAGFDLPRVVYTIGSVTDTLAMESAGGSTYRFSIPSERGDEAAYYFAGTSGGGDWTDPRTAPDEQYRIDGMPVVPSGYAFYFMEDEIGEPHNPVDRGKRGASTFFFDLPAAQHVSITIYNPAGRLVRDLLGETVPEGEGHSAVWDLKNDGGEDVAAGVYMLLFEAEDFETKRRIVIL